MNALMKLFEGKSKTERNKTIAAIVLGVACLIVLFMAFGRGFFSSSPSTRASSTTPTPTPTVTVRNTSRPEMPSQQDQLLDMTTQPVIYSPAVFGAPDPGRNIFAFYEPPKPTPYVPTPVPPTPFVAPTPTPPPPIQIAVINPQSVFAGSNGFRMEIVGDRFTPDTKIYFDMQEIPSTYISEQRMTADIPSVLIRNDGRPRIMAQTADGTKYSNRIELDVQPPPRPQFLYIGMVRRQRGNNDMAYFREPGKELPTIARLNDVVGGRFRLVSISAEQTILEDVNLGFKHRLALHDPPPTAAPAQPGGVQPGRGLPGGGPTMVPVNPGGQPQPGDSRIPGIPDNIPRYIPPGSNSNTNRVPANTKRDVDDDEDGRK